MIEDGASVLDIGAQSTRPNYAEVSADEEIRRFEKTVEDDKKPFRYPRFRRHLFFRKRGSGVKFGCGYDK